MNWLKKVMAGRYGVDQLSNGMLILSITIIAIGMLTKVNELSTIAVLILGVSYFRILSKNINKRYEENLKFLKKWNPIKSKWLSFTNRIKQSKTHKFFKCPSCAKELRVPKGKGKINITCPSCNTKFEKRT